VQIREEKKKTPKPVSKEFFFCFIAVELNLLEIAKLLHIFGVKKLIK
jgi:hypothetical protein